MPDENGEIRRDRNLNAGLSSPEVFVPPQYANLWEWYFAISNCLKRIHEGVCVRLPPSEIAGWKALTDTDIRPSEIAVLFTMDKAYVEAVNEELVSYRERQEEARRTKK